MPVNINKETVIYDDLTMRTGYGYPRGSINGMIRYNDLIKDFEFGVNEQWVRLSEIQHHPLEHLIRYTETLKEFEFFIEDKWVLRCDCPRPTPEPPLPATTTPMPPRVRPELPEFYLMVRFNPPEVRDDAMWNVSGYTGIYPHNHTKLMKVGAYTVYFLDVDGWIAPPSVNTTIHAGMPFDTRQIVAEYVRRTFELTVVIEPDDVHEDARWTIDDDLTEYIHNHTLTNVSAGEHTIKLNNVNGWIKPADVLIVIDETRVSDHITVTVEYEQSEYGLQVLFEPTDVRADARWITDKTAGSRSHGEIISGIEVGTYIIEMNDVSGWITPANVTATIEDPLTDNIKVVTVTYEPEPYLIQVIIKPDDVIESARWLVSNDAVQYASEETASRPMGTYTIQCTDVPGWKTPDNNQVILEPGMPDDTYILYVEYEPKTYTLQVNIDPADVRDTATWSVDGITGIYAHSESIADMEIGEYVISFSTVTDWIKPEDIETSITDSMPNDTRIVTGVYTTTPAPEPCVDNLYPVEHDGVEIGQYLIANVTYENGFFKEYMLVTELSNQTAITIDGWYRSSFGRPVHYDGLIIYYDLILEHGEDRAHLEFLESDQYYAERACGPVDSIITLCETTIQPDTVCIYVIEPVIYNGLVLADSIQAEITYTDHSTETKPIITRLYDNDAIIIDNWHRDAFGRSCFKLDLMTHYQNFINDGESAAKTAFENDPKYALEIARGPVTSIRTDACDLPLPVYETEPPCEEHETPVWYSDVLLGNSVNVYVLYENDELITIDAVYHTSNNVATEISSWFKSAFGRPVNSHDLIELYARYDELGDIDLVRNEFYTSRDYETERSKGPVVEIKGLICENILDIYEVCNDPRVDIIGFDQRVLGQYVRAQVTYTDDYSRSYNLLFTSEDSTSMVINEWYTSSFGRPVDDINLKSLYQTYTEDGHDAAFNSFKNADAYYEERAHGPVTEMITSTCSDNLPVYDVTVPCHEREFISTVDGVDVARYVNATVTYNDGHTEQRGVFIEILDSDANTVNYWFEATLGRPGDNVIFPDVYSSYKTNGASSAFLYMMSLASIQAEIEHGRVTEITGNMCSTDYPVAELCVDNETAVLSSDGIIGYTISTRVSYTDTTIDSPVHLVIRTVGETAETINNWFIREYGRASKSSELIYYYELQKSSSMSDAYTHLISSEAYATELARCPVIEIYTDVCGFYKPIQPPSPAERGIYAYVDTSSSMNNDIILDGTEAPKICVAEQILTDFELIAYPATQPLRCTMSGNTISGLRGSSVTNVELGIYELIRDMHESAYNNKLTYLIINDTQDAGTADWGRINYERNSVNPDLRLEVIFARLGTDSISPGIEAQLNAFFLSDDTPDWVTYSYGNYDRYNTGGTGTDLGDRLRSVIW